jgi:hypothetical protein
LLICLGAVVFAGAARADGAFPDSDGILAPAGLPHDIFLGFHIS